MSSTPLRPALVALALAALFLGVSGCNTVRGIGDDIKSVGRAGERALD